MTQRVVGLLFATVLLPACSATVARDAASDAGPSLDRTEARDTGVDAERTTPGDARADADRAVPDDVTTCDPSVLGDAGPEDVASAVDGPYVIDLAASAVIHVCAVMSDHTVRCRGDNQSGQLGQGTFDGPVGAPQPVPDLDDVVQVITRPYVTCTRHRDGRVRCWGLNRYGALGVGHEGDEPCEFAGEMSGCRTRPTLVPGLDDVTQIATNWYTTCAVRQRGEVWCWGADLLGPGTPTDTPVRVEPLHDVVAVWPVSTVWLVRFRSGQYAWYPSVSWLPDVPPDAEIDEVLSSAFHVCFRVSDSSVRCLGDNQSGELGNGTSSGDGTVPATVNPGLCGVRAMSAGAYDSCAVLANRSVWCWGDGSDGALGVDARQRCVGGLRPTMCETRPVRVPGIDRVEQLFPGVWGTCARRTDHSLWCWGSLAIPGSTVPTRVDW